MKHFLFAYLLGWLMMVAIFGTMAFVIYLERHYYPGPPSPEFIGGTFAAIATAFLLVMVALPIFVEKIS